MYKCSRLKRSRIAEHFLDTGCSTQTQLIVSTHDDELSSCSGMRSLILSNFLSFITCQMISNEACKTKAASNYLVDT